MGKLVGLVVFALAIWFTVEYVTTGALPWAPSVADAPSGGSDPGPPTERARRSVERSLETRSALLDERSRED